jgi:chromosome segregation ATPase
VITPLCVLTRGRKLRRERKKQKYSEMQLSVDVLANQLGQLSMLQKENKLLRGNVQELQVTIQKKNLQLKQHQEQLKTTQQILTKQVGTIREQQAAISKQDKHSKEQSAQMQALQDKIDNSLDTALLSLEPDTVSSKVVAAVKSAMMGSKEFKGLHPTLGQMPDALVQTISTTLTRCCAEMYLQLKQSARNEPPAAIQVPCC